MYKLIRQSKTDTKEIDLPFDRLSEIFIGSTPECLIQLPKLNDCAEKVCALELLDDRVWVIKNASFKGDVNCNNQSISDKIFLKKGDLLTIILGTKKMSFAFDQSDTPLRKKQARSLTPGKRTDDKENSSPNVQKINKERTDKKPKKAEDEVQNHYLLIQKFILEQNEFVLQLKSENERLKEETKRFLPEHVGTLSIREVEQIESQLQKLLREIEKIRNEKEIEAQKCHLCRQKPKSRMVFLGSKCLCESCSDDNLLTFF
jgi:hypothetical protein